MGLSMMLHARDRLGRPRSHELEPQNLYRLNTQTTTGSCRDFIEMVKLFSHTIMRSAVRFSRSFKTKM